MKTPAQIGKYRVLREIGRGGMGVVFEAENTEVRHRVAIKMLNAEYASEPQVLARFRSEGIAANLPRHAGIIHVLERGVHEPDGIPYIVMEYVDGESLRRRLQRHKEGLPIKTVLRFGKQLTDALAAAHAHKIIHRDIKPENIMITRDSAVPGGERTKILDFGIAVIAKENLSLSIRETQVNTNPFGPIIGTIAYMPPEQWHGYGRDKLDAKADVYAMGAMFYELLTGQPPFVAEEAITVGYMHINKEPVPLTTVNPKVPAALATLVSRMLNKAPGQRPSMKQVYAQLERMEAAASNSQLDAIPDPPRLSRWAALGLGVVALLVALGIALESWLGHGPGTSKVRWRITTQPPGASVMGPGGRVLGVTPWLYERPRDVGHLMVTLKLPGYRTTTLKLDRSQSQDQTLPLVPEP
jgi:serine/threonine-protein kinase